MTMSAVNEDLSQALALQNARIKPTFGYYRQPNGWITVSPITRLEQVRYQEEGWTRLAQYGAFDMSTEYAAGHPLELLFMLGGAKELAIDQVLQMGLHLNPDPIPTCRQPLTQHHRKHVPACLAGAVPPVFPQLAGYDGPLGPFECRFCGDDRPTEAARERHERVAHKDEQGDIRSGQALADALGKALKPPASETDALLRMLEDQGEAMAAMRTEIAELRAHKAK